MNKIKEQEILEGNKLIALFMQETINQSGKHINLNEDHPMFKKYGSICGMYQHSECYHSSWDWLMPVVEKIEALGFWVNIKKNHVSICWDNKGTTDSKMVHSEWGDQSKIQRVFTCVVSFIRWYKYNENKRIKERN